MKFRRVVVLLICLLAILPLFGCAPTEQEKVWTAFTDAVAEKRVDDAMQYVDFSRMVQKTMGDDSEAQAALALFGGPEGMSSILEGAFREALSGAKEDADSSGLIGMKKPVRVETDGDFSTLVFEVDGSETTVQMEKIDGEWKIVDFGDALGDDAEDAEGDENLPGGPGTYTFEENGTRITAQVPGPEDDAVVAEVEAYRKKVGADPVSYILVEVDNTDGKEQSYLGAINVVTEDGSQIEFSNVSSVMGDWYTDEQNSDLYNAGVELSNKYLNATDTLPGAKSKTLFVATEEIPTIKSVWLDGERMAKEE